MLEIDWASLTEYPPCADWQLASAATTDTPLYTYALLDACRIDQLMRQIYQTSDLPAYAFLYAQTDSQHLLDVSPVLLALTQHEHDFSPIIEQLAIERAGLIIRSPLALSDLANHLRRFLLVPDPAGESYLRFYDPAIWLALHLMQQTSLIAGDAIHDISLPYWLNSGVQHWVHLHYAPSTPPQIYSGNDLNSGDQLDDVSVQTRLLYWVGQHDALAGQDWMMSEFLELFTVIRLLISRGLTCDWELTPWLSAVVDYTDQINQSWLQQWILNDDIENVTESQIRARLDQYQQSPLMFTE
jgi:hypothetical protein